MSESFVYFLRPIGQVGPIKIGCSIQPRGRVKQLGEFSTVRLEIVATVPGGDFALERNLHECFLDTHSHHEWFNASPRLTACIEALQAGKPIQLAVDLTKRLGRFAHAKGGHGETTEASVERAAFKRAKAKLSAAIGKHWPVDIDVLMIHSQKHVPFTNAQRARIRAVLADPSQFLSPAELVEAYAALREPQPLAEAA